MGALQLTFSAASPTRFFPAACTVDDGRLERR
jgi:hypothetical protein